MMRVSSLLLLILILALAALGTFWLLNLDGRVTLALPGGSEISLSLGLAILLGALTAGLVAVAWWLLTSVLILPWTLGKARQESLTRKANRTLTDGLLAAEGGDARAALKLARKAARHAEDERLKLLVEARAAEAGEDWSGAERAWGQLTRLPGGELPGLRGAASAAIERGDRVAAEQRAREALTLKSDADWPFTSLFDLQVARHDWSSALETLAMGERKGRIQSEPVRRRRAVLKTAHAVSLPGVRRQEAQKALADAIRAAPDFPPAAWHGARHLMIDGKPGSAHNLLEVAWKARPHPALAQLARRLDPNENAPDRRRRLESLVSANPSARESRILSAEIAIEAERWIDAVKHLALLVEEKPTARLCQLMSHALKGYGDSGEAERWSGMAATAAREADWSDIDPRGGAFDYAAADWARLVYHFGDVGDLVHPRHEAFDKEIEAGRALALAAPEVTATDVGRHLSGALGDSAGDGEPATDGARAAVEPPEDRSG